ncbi:MAG: ABC transporter ATP-binding protein [Candidatus Xenobia bacterium]
MTEAVIRVEELSRVYEMGEHRVQAVRGVSFEVVRGEMVAIMGPSGSGKSSMMNTLGCLDRPSSGHYWLDGVDVSALDKDALAHIRNEKIGFVFQGFNLLSRTSAVENVELPLLYGGSISGKERRARAMECLDLVGLVGRADHVPAQLSGGEQQRVAIARALVNRPALVLADEPTGNLDTHRSIEIMALFQRLNREQGLTIVMVTHESDIAAYCKRVIRFRDGRIVNDEPIQTRDALAALDGVAPES